MNIYQLYFILLFGIATIHYIQGYEALLVRTKRKPFSEYDYIEDSKDEVQKRNKVKNPVRTQRNAKENLNSEESSEPTFNVFQHLIQKSNVKRQLASKTSLHGQHKDPFVKLKEFFDELRKRSVDDEDLHEEETEIVQDDTDMGPNLEVALDDLKNSENKMKILNSQEERQPEVGQKMPNLELDNFQVKSSQPDVQQQNDTEKMMEINEEEEAVSGSGESGDSGSGVESEDSESGSGSGLASTVDIATKVEKRSTSDDFSELFSSKIKKSKWMERNKREINDDDDNVNDDDLHNSKFGGMPERLAIIKRENPRVKILKREARNKHIPDIPLPFNNMKTETTNQNYEKENTSIEQRHVITHDIPRVRKVENIPTFTKIIPYKEFTSLNVFKRSLGEEKFKNLRIIDEDKAKSLFDDDEGDFLSHIKRDGIYYDTRHNRFLISAKAEDINNNRLIETPIMKRHTETEPGKASAKKEIKMVKHHTKRDIHDNKTEDKNQSSSLPTDNANYKGSVTGKNETKSSHLTKLDSNKTEQIENHTKPAQNLSNKTKPKLVVKRNVIDDDVATKQIVDDLKIFKRNILPDDDPNTDYLMRYDGKNDMAVDYKKARIKREKQMASVKKAEKVYIFAKSVMDLVGEPEKRKDKRQIKSSSLTGVWSGLGTQPEFVPGLFKRDYDDSKQYELKAHSVRKLTKDQGHNIITERKNRSKRQKEFPPLRNNLKQKRNTERDRKNSMGNEEESAISKRDVIPNDDDDYEELVKSVNDDSSTQNKDQHKIRRDANEQSEAKQMELGSLGAMNMAIHKSAKVIKRSTEIKTRRERLIHQSKKKGKIVTKRFDHEKDVAHITTTNPFQDGKVVLAFDEVKELLPTKHFFSKNEERLLEPANEVHSRMTITKGMEPYFDVDKDLVESMVLSGDNKRSNVMGLKATNVIYENNENIANGRSKIKNPSLLKTDAMLKKAQLSKILSDEVQPKQDQIKNWINSKQDVAESETTRKIQDVSDQLVESNAELERLKATNKEEEDTAYLAKKLEEKNTAHQDTPEIREEKFRKLQQDILDEQNVYKKLLEEQHRQYQEKIENDRQTGYQTGKTYQEPSVAIQNNTLTMQNGVNSASSNGNNLPTVNSKMDSTLKAGTIKIETVPNTNTQILSEAHENNVDGNAAFQAVVQAPEPQQITFDKLDPRIGDYHQQIISTPQSLEHFERVHNPSLSNETFPEEYTHEYISNSTTPKPDTTLQQTTHSIPIHPTLPTLGNNTTLAASAQNATTTTMTTLRATTTPNTSSTVPVKAQSTSTTTKATVPPTTTTTQAATTKVPPIPTKVTTIKSTPVNILMSNFTTTSPPLTTLAPVAKETIKTPIETASVHNESIILIQPENNVTNSSLESIIVPQNENMIQPFQFPNNSLPNGTKQTKIVIESDKNLQIHYTNLTEGNIGNSVQPTPNTHAQDYNSTDANGTQQISSKGNQTPLIDKSMGKLPFPLEIAYRPRVLTNMTKKKIEMEPRADGYIGCFIDHLVQGRDLPVRAGIPMVTPTNCRNACKKTGYKYAGLQYGYLCFCGNSYGKYDIVPDSECNNVCSGDDSFTCGGLWRNEIFDTEHVSGSYDGKVPYYMPPKQRLSMDEVPGMVKSDIPLTPSILEYDDKRDGDLQNEVQYSEYSDIKALDNLKTDAIKRSDIGIVRRVGNFTDDDLINAAALEITLHHAAQNDTSFINQSPLLSSNSETALNVANEEEKVLETFAYLHPQNQQKDELMHSPVAPLMLEPGTHLFRGELILQQPWYDDLKKPASTKYRILSGNIEVALKNIFANESSFLKAEVMSLSEDDKTTPHKTTADFTITFSQGQSTERVTHKLMDSVFNTKHLDEMPVVPSSLKVKEYLHDSNAQAFIPKVLDGKIHLDTSSPITLQYNSDHKIVHNDIASLQQQPQTTLSLNKAFQRMLQSPSVTSFSSSVNSNELQQQSSEVLNPAVKTYIRPAVSDGIKELKNYMSEQTVNERAAQRNIVNIPTMLPTAEQKVSSNLESQPKKKKVPYVLRMFFWKDMLARKKRENNIDELAKYKSTAKKQKIIHFTNGLPIIRERRSQADEWPTTYKKDDEKRSYNSKFLKRKKRVLNENDEHENDEYDTLFDKTNKRETQSTKSVKQGHREKRTEKHTTIKKEIISDSLIKGMNNKSAIEKEDILSRNKRNNSNDETDR